MFKKRILCFLLTVTMLLSLVALNVSASGTTDAISAVKLDSTSYTQVGNQYNKMILSAYNVTSVQAQGDDANEEKIGGDENCCLTYSVGDKGITDDSRFLIWNVTLNETDPTQPPTSNERFDIAAATVPTYWSVDVYDNGAINGIEMRAGGNAMHTAVTADKLTDNAWNTFAVVHYPNATDETKMGYADFYLNGKFVETRDMSKVSSATIQTRFGFKFTAADAVAYFDNVKVYEMTSFTRPAVVLTGDITVSDGVISNYGRTTVASLESTLGVEILEADGTAAADDATVTKGMKSIVSNTISGVGTFTADYTFGEDGYTDIKTVIADSSVYTHGWNYGYNRRICSGSGVTHLQSNTEPEYRCTVNAVETLGRWAVAKTSGEPNTSSYATVEAARPNEATTYPMYWSVDVFGSSVVNKLQMCTDGNSPMAPEVSYSQLKANEWNTLALVYYPNTEDTTKLGYADFYLNGKYIETTDLSTLASASRGKEYRMTFYGNNTTDYFRFDNIKLYEMKSFVRPDVNSGVSVIGGKITGYLTSTVGELETATGANIVNADGTDADANAVAVPGMKAVVSGTVEGVGTFITERELGSPDKVYVSEDFSSDSYKNVIDDAIGFQHVIEGDTLKMTTLSRDDNSDGTMDLRFAVKSALVTDIETGRISPGHGDPLVYSIDLKPAAGMRSLRFDTSGQKWADELPASMFTIGEWNNVTMVFYKTALQFDSGWESDIYVNNKLVSRGYRNSSEALHNPLRFHVVTASTGDVYYIDNLVVSAATEFVRPEFTSETYNVYGGSGISIGTIRGYKNMTVQRIKDGAVKADDVTVEVYNADGSVAAASKAVDKTMYVVATRDEYSRRYNFGDEAYTILNWVCTLNGEALTGNTYTPGELVVQLPVANYISEEPVTFTLFIAEYEGDRFVNAARVPASVTTVDGYGQAEYTLTAGHTYKIFAYSQNYL